MRGHLVVNIPLRGARVLVFVGGEYGVSLMMFDPTFRVRKGVSIPLL